MKHVYFIAQIYKILVSGTRMGAVPFYPLAKAVGREQPVLVTYCGMIPRFRYPHKPRRPLWRTDSETNCFEHATSTLAADVKY